MAVPWHRQDGKNCLRGYASCQCLWAGPTLATRLPPPPARPGAHAASLPWSELPIARQIAMTSLSLRHYLGTACRGLQTAAAMAGFDTAAWLAANPPSSCGSPHVSQPVALAPGYWTKAAAGGGGGGERIRFGDASGGWGLRRVFVVSFPLFFVSERSPFFPLRTAGLLPYVQPRVPASLDAGEYIAKGPDEEFGVETLIRAAAAAGASLADCDVLTYRNNLNK